MAPLVPLRCPAPLNAPLKWIAAHGVRCDVSLRACGRKVIYPGGERHISSHFYALAIACRRFLRQLRERQIPESSGTAASVCSQASFIC